MIINVHNSCADYDSYRAARVKSLFNCESGADFRISAELPAEDNSWKIGVIVGPSGSGKSSIARRFWPGVAPTGLADSWPADQPIIDAIAPDGDFNAVTAALAAVGLGSVPSWLRPFHVLSCGEQFRAGLARIITAPDNRVIVDEFSSALDRQVATIAAGAFAKSWRRRPAGQCLVVTCHRDVIAWLTPDWVFDTAAGQLSGRYLQRPRFVLDIYRTNWRYWPIFEPHHYLKVPHMIAAKCYVGCIDNQPVCHLAVSSRNKGAGVEARACRLVVLPEWQGAGVGLRFLNQVCEWNLTGSEGGRFPGRPVTTLFHTSHPGLAAALRRSPLWRQVSARLFGKPKRRNIMTVAKSAAAHPERPGVIAGYGGHFRAVQGFRYVGSEVHDA